MKLFYILNRGYNGDFHMFWRIDGHGYTTNLREAWQVPEEKALQICRSRPTEDFAYACENIDAVSYPAVNSELMRAIKPLRYCRST